MTLPQINRTYKQENSIRINAPKQEVWEILKDFNNVYTWAPSVSDSYGLGDKREEVGAGRYCKVEGFGEIEEYIRHWYEGTGFIYDVTPLGPFKNTMSRWEIQSINATTTQLNMYLTYDLRFGVLGKMMHKVLLNGKLKASVQDTLKSFKHRVETGELVRPLMQEAA